MANPCLGGGYGVGYDLYVDGEGCKALGLQLSPADALGHFSGALDGNPIQGTYDANTGHITFAWFLFPGDAFSSHHYDGYVIDAQGESLCGLAGTKSYFIFRLNPPSFSLVTNGWYANNPQGILG